VVTQSPPSSDRVTYFAFTVGTIALGLAVHQSVTILPAALRDIAGDALWAMMVGWGLGVFAPRMPLVPRAVLALALSWIVEFSQLYHAPAIDGWRHTTLGRLVLGSGFDARDLGAYALGVIAMVMIERALGRGSRLVRDR
jgi:hypothetical protein